MGYDRTRIQGDLLPIRVESGKLLAPSSVGARIENFYDTPEGSLRSLDGPAPWLPDYGQGYFAYGNMHGVFHALLMQGSRDVLLIHSGARIYVFEGWNRTWATLVGPSGSGAQVTMDIPDHTGPQFPCQFELTPTGIVIVPQGARAVFYDGIVALPFGYDRAPGPPLGRGPESSGSTASNANDRGYSVSRRGDAIHMGTEFGYGRLGSFDSDIGGSGTGGILRGTYQGAMQWINRWGDVSPLSKRSNEIRIARQWSAAGIYSPDVWGKEALWTGLENGPTGTIGKILSRTKDMVNSGTTRLFEVPPDVGAGAVSAFATIPDNVSKQWPDNVPDAWLVNEPIDAMPVPVFKLCRMAMGRLWIANTSEDPGILIPSLLGRYGTFERNSEMFPDPQGGEITGLWAVSASGVGGVGQAGSGGLLVFTATSTYFVVEDESGQGFVSMPLHPTVGCVAPSSIASMSDGSVVWLGREGFYRFDGKTIGLISGEETSLVERFNQGRLLQACALFDPRTREYRCWLPFDGARENNICLTWQGDGFRRRTGNENFRAVYVKKDHTRDLLGAGRVTDSGGTTRDGLWWIDRQVRSFTPASREARLETAWIEPLRSKDRTGPQRLFLWLRETHDTALATIEVYRDWRMDTVVYTGPTSGDLGATLRSPEDRPPVWGVTTYNQTTDPNAWIRRRPYWKRVDIEIPSCEVFKVVIRTTSRMEFLGLAVDEKPQAGSARVP